MKRKDFKKVCLLGVLLLPILLGGCANKEDDPVVGFHNELFGENTYIFSPQDDPAAVQAVLDDIYRTQETGQFDERRFALYFLPGEYDESLNVNVGFYTQVAGLGMQPTDTKLPTLMCLARWLGDAYNHNATCNFWRGVENIELQNKTIWAVSQATSMRHVQIDQALYLHDDYGWASGGFLSDSRIALMVDSGSQQQWLSRNNAYRTWMGENWNIVFEGDDPDGIPIGTWPVKSYTTVKETVEMREKPYLVCQNGEFFVYVPEVRKDAIGPSWDADNATAGELIPTSDFYVAKEGACDADSLQQALDDGKYLFFTPGIYDLDHELVVTRANTIVLGSGLATLRSANGNVCIRTDHAEGVILAGLLFDAGEKPADALVVVGDAGETSVLSQTPTMLSDIYFRVGGTDTEKPARSNACIIVNASHVIGDNLWVWRADHGDQVGWDQNVTKNGIIINGDDVAMHALMVEHFHEYQTIWNGERGRLVMYQSEIPYDVPTQDVWRGADGTVDGYASIYIPDTVQEFEADGIGIYLYNRDAAVTLHAAMEASEAPGVDIRHIITVMLTGNPGMEHVINDVGGAVMQGGETEMVLHYQGGIDKRFS